MSPSAGAADALAALRSADRVAVIGVCGSGKSTLARELAPLLGLPLVHLDRVYWRAGWEPTPRKEWIARHAELIARERWLIDGLYSSTMAERVAAADVVIHLECSTARATWRVLARKVTHLGRTRDDLADGCVERIDRSTITFVRYVLAWRRTRLPRVRELLAAKPAGTVIELRTRRDVDHLLARAARGPRGPRA